MKTKHLFFIGFLIFIGLAACSQNPEKQIMNFEECVKAGYPAMESYPRQCSHKGKTFVEQITSTNPENPNTPDDQTCTKEFKPVCGIIKDEIACMKADLCDNYKMTFDNRCEAEKLGAKNITDGACKESEIVPQDTCLSWGGWKWLSDFQECEGMSKEMCKNLGGSYNECASACRHNPNAEVCTQQCVQVCKF